MWVGVFSQSVFVSIFVSLCAPMSPSLFFLHVRAARWRPFSDVAVWTCHAQHALGFGGCHRRLFCAGFVLI